MPTKSVLKSLVLLFAVALLAVAGACSTDSPTAPERPTPTPPGGGGGGTTAFSVTVSAQPGTVTAGSDDPVVITVRAVRSDNGQPAPTGTLAVVSAFEGSFGTPDGPQSVTVELVDGVAQLAYFPPVDEEGSVIVQATVAGNRGQVTIEIEGTATFFVSHVTPASGSPQGGDTVAIVGNGFDGPARVLFGGTNAVVLSVSPTRITVRTPPSPGATNATTTVPVTVIINLNEEDEATDTVVGAFTYAPGGGDVRQPTIFSITPTTGQNEGGTPVSIIGEGFQSPVQVEFGNASVFLEAQIVSVSANRIEVRAPAATGFGSSLRDQTVSIRVTNLNSGLTVLRADAFRYGVALQVTGLSPDVVDATAPALVTIFGSGFESPLQVIVGGVQQQVVSVTGTQIVFRPAPVTLTGCGTVIDSRSVTVRLLNTNAEASVPGAGLSFRADIPQPQITSVSPNTGSPNGGQAVNIGGSGFAAPVRALFGGAAATVNSVSATQVQVTTPPLAGGLATVECTVPDGRRGTRTASQAVNVLVENLLTGCQDVLPGGFTYTPTSTACVPNPQCSDGIDNDGDGLIDSADPGCSGPTDNDETDPAP
jgi:large repetitive protein